MMLVAPTEPDLVWRDPRIIEVAKEELPGKPTVIAPAGEGGGWAIHAASAAAGA